MYSAAPRCSEAVSVRSVPACGRSPPSSAANTGEASSRPPTSMPVASRLVNNVERTLGMADLVMRRHPFRHGPGPVEAGPHRHGDEEREVEEGQRASDDHFG